VIFKLQHLKEPHSRAACKPKKTSTRVQFSILGGRAGVKNASGISAR